MHCAFCQSTRYHMVVRLKACGNVTLGGFVKGSEWNPLLGLKERFDKGGSFSSGGFGDTPPPPRPLFVTSLSS